MSSNGEQSMVDFTFHQPPKEREPMAGSRLQPEDFQSAAVTFACKTQHDGHRSILFPHNIFSCYLLWIACVSGAARITITKCNSNHFAKIFSVEFVRRSALVRKMPGRDRNIKSN